jgi:hypothetical protein
MKLVTAMGLVVCVALAQSGNAGPVVPIAHELNDASDPYAIISERNIFHLNPIPPEAPPEMPKVELPVVKFFGFVRVGRVTKALFSSEPKDKKEAPTYYSLTEGEKSGILEVVRIHYEKGEVEVIDSGKAMTLTLKDDSLASKQGTPAPKPYYHPTHEIPFRSSGQPLGGFRGFSQGGNVPSASPSRARRSPVP